MEVTVEFVVTDIVSRILRLGAVDGDVQSSLWIHPHTYITIRSDPVDVFHVYLKRIRQIM